MFLRDFTRHAAAAVSAAPIFAAPATRPMTPALTGLTATTLVETVQGWRDATSLRIGDAVQTLDGGAVRIAALTRQDLGTATPLIHLPGGGMDNCSDLLLLPRQMLLIDTLGGHDAPYALISAAALLEMPGVSLRRSACRVEVITPIFASEEAVWANSGVLIHCPGAACGDSFYPSLTSAEARAILALRVQMAA